MIIDIPIQYHANVVALRKRNGEDHKLLESARVALRETTAAEAPVVMWWSEHAHAVQVAVRSFEGDLYTPYGWSKNNLAHSDSTPCPAPDLASRPTPGSEEFDWFHSASPDPVGLEGVAARLAAGTLHFSGREMASAAAPQGGRMEDLALRKIVSSSLDKVREAWERAAGLLLSVDGVMYAKASVPVLVVEKRFHHETVLRAGWTGDREGTLGRLGSAARTFAVTEHDAALAAWRKARIAEKGYDFEHDEPGNDPYLTGRMPAPEILRPDLLPALDSQAYSVAETARSTLIYLEGPCSSSYGSYPYGTPTVATYDRPLMVAYAHLRSALADGADARALLDRLADVREATERHGTLHNLRDDLRLLADRVSESDADLDAFEGLDGPTDFPGAP